MGKIRVNLSLINHDFKYYDTLPNHIIIKQLRKFCRWGIYNTSISNTENIKDLYNYVESIKGVIIKDANNGTVWVELSLS